MLEADIALDPFPFNGGTTSCEALWVGLPVISLTTDSFIGRQGLRCLTRTGIADLASDSEEHYVANALKLAADRDRLADLRLNLPARVSAVCSITTSIFRNWKAPIVICGPVIATV
ncbi:MAG: hypothetical protein CFH40_01193 [Alphaproteobacteria bacterium MarineAlpha10_Bin3]|nr:MAG: hypothetical protein CFH40_01193 [Alphaproteobacteria bacterium MarineAlpha10_Bin3]PPR71408.1 MAG: hypothetical protein CFH09_01193 [Alphaproteobacteria bacterium MarineAlpha4_Bin1]